MPFVRSLDPKVVNALNELSLEEGNWWKTLVEDSRVFIAVRRNELNAYFGGASLGRIAWKKRALSFRVHVEYLVFADRDRKDMYFDFLQESEFPKSVIVKDTQDYVKHFEDVKALAKEVASSRERAGVNHIAAGNGCVLDIEAAFNTLSEPRDSGINPEPVGGRIDLVAVNQQSQLIFTEAKLFLNDDLRLDPLPPVCSQLISYHQWLESCRAEIQQAYTCLIATCPLKGKFFERWDSLREKTLTLDPTPRLLIFDYDADRDGAELEQIKKRIVEEVSPRISGFGPQHIRCQERATQIHASDIL